MQIKYFVSIFIGLLAIAPIKNADAVTKQEQSLCNAFGDAAYTIAVNRDEGVNKFEMRQRIISSFESNVRDSVLMINDMVFRKPWHLPELEAQLIIAECVKQVEQRISL